MKNIGDYADLKQKSITYSPSDLVTLLGFNKAMRTAWEMLENDNWEDELQTYATALFEEVRHRYPDLWNSDWRYDALLGCAYDIILNYDERFVAFKRAFEKAIPPPPELLVALARCRVCPGEPPITAEEAIALVKRAISTTVYVEAAALLRVLYGDIDDTEKEQYWKDVWLASRKTGVHLPLLDQPPAEIETAN